MYVVHVQIHVSCHDVVGASWVSNAPLCVTARAVQTSHTFIWSLHRQHVGVNVSAVS